jgi:hypothetical protein
MIGDRMIADILHADLVVADLTDLNPNAFYELGIRHSAEMPAIHIVKAGTVIAEVSGRMDRLESRMGRVGVSHPPSC